MGKPKLSGACAAFLLTLGLHAGWAQTPAPMLFGSGTATIDGVVSPGEWAMARCTTVPITVPQGATPGTVCAMNDAVNLYLMTRFARPAGDRNSAAFEFDTDRSGSITQGDDGLLINPELGFLDEVRVGCGVHELCGWLDTQVGGTQDGTGAFVNDGSISTYEFSHPLDSADDAHDISLHRGDSIASWVFVRIMPPSGGIFDTDWIAAHIAVTIPIEIGRKEVNWRSNAQLPVAILSTSALDVPATIEPTSLTFGRSGDETSLRSCRYHDVNRDGLPDLLCHFSTRAAGFQAGDTLAVLKGRRLDGSPAVGMAGLAVR